MLPAPEPDEVVPVLLEEGEVGVIVELFGWIGAVRTEADAVVEVVLEVRTSQIHDAAIGAGWIVGRAGGNGEVAWVAVGDHEGTRGGVWTDQRFRRTVLRGIRSARRLGVLGLVLL